MLKYILKRLLNMIPVLIIVSMILFGILQMMPGDPVQAYLGEGSKQSPEQIAMLRKKMGLDQPLPVQYVKWLRNVLQRDFGESIQYKKPVKDVMGTFIWNSFLLNIVGMILAFLIAIPVGIKAAVKKYSVYDNFWTVFSLVGISMPSFFFGLLLIFGFSVKLGWTPVNGMITAGMDYPSKLAEYKDVAYHMILPVTVITIATLASVVKYVRNSMLEVIQQDYIRTARAKGLSEKVVIYKHAFRNALIPVVTLVGLYIPTLFSGSVVLETIFIWPGIGNVLYEAVMNRDYPLVLASNMFFAVLLLIGNLLSDIGYALVDPRVKVD